MTKKGFTSNAQNQKQIIPVRPPLAPSWPPWATYSSFISHANNGASRGTRPSTLMPPHTCNDRGLLKKRFIRNNWMAYHVTYVVFIHGKVNQGPSLIFRLSPDTIMSRVHWPCEFYASAEVGIYQPPPCWIPADIHPICVETIVSKNQPDHETML